MAQVLVIYHSKTGNTEMMSQAVEEGLKEGEVEVVRKKISETSVDDLIAYDGIIIGTPTYFAGTTAEIKRLLDDSIKYYKKLVGKVGGAFSSCGVLGGGGETAILDILHAFLVHGMVVQGFTIESHYGTISIGKPDPGRINACKEFGKKMASLVRRFFP